MTKKQAGVIAMIAFAALIKPMGNLIEFVDLVWYLIVDGVASPRWRMYNAILQEFGFTAMCLTRGSFDCILAAIPALLIYRYLRRRDFAQVCISCAAHKIRAWSLLVAFLVFTLLNPSITMRHVPFEAEDIPLDEAMEHNQTATLELRLSHPENDRLERELKATNAEDIVRRWCRSPDAFVKDETLSIPMQCGQIPDDVKSACRILASKNPDVLLAAYSVLILRDYEYRFRDFGQYPPTHLDPAIPWEVARWTLSRLGLLLELRRAEDEGVEIGISPYVDGILGKCEEIFKDDLYGMELVARVNVLRDKLNYRYMCQSLDTFRESIPSVDDVREYRFWEGKDFSFRSIRTNDVCRGSCVCLHKVEKSVGNKVLQLLASARGNSGWRHSYGEDYPFHFRELDCVLQNGDTVTIRMRINDGLTSGFIICSARQCWGGLVCPPQEIWRELSEIFLKVSREASGSAKCARKGKRR